jgi:hypothetical protein
MYGTVARMRVKSGELDQVRKLMEVEMAREVKGYVGSYVYKMDRDENEIMLAVLFDDKNTYVANADDPSQDEMYQKLRALLTEDPEWNDGEVIYSD